MLQAGMIVHRNGAGVVASGPAGVMLVADAALAATALKVVTGRVSPGATVTALREEGATAFLLDCTGRSPVLSLLGDVVVTAWAWGATGPATWTEPLVGAVLDASDWVAFEVALPGAASGAWLPLWQGAAAAGGIRIGHPPSGATVASGTGPAIAVPHAAPAPSDPGSEAVTAPEPTPPLVAEPLPPAVVAGLAEESTPLTQEADVPEGESEAPWASLPPAPEPSEPSVVSADRITAPPSPERTEPTAEPPIPAEPESAEPARTEALSVVPPSPAEADPIELPPADQPGPAEPEPTDAWAPAEPIVPEPEPRDAPAAAHIGPAAPDELAPGEEVAASWAAPAVIEGFTAATLPAPAVPTTDSVPSATEVAPVSPWGIPAALPSGGTDAADLGGGTTPPAAPVNPELFEETLTPARLAELQRTRQPEPAAPAPAPAPQEYLVYAGTAPVTIDGDVVLGRDPDMRALSGRRPATTMRLPSPLAEISRSHCVVLHEPGRAASVMDVGSANGTALRRSDGRWLALQPRTAVALEDGDLIHLGEGVVVAYHLR